MEYKVVLRFKTRLHFSFHAIGLQVRCCLLLPDVGRLLRYLFLRKGASPFLSEPPREVLGEESTVSSSFLVLHSRNSKYISSRVSHVSNFTVSTQPILSRGCEKKKY